MRLRAATFVLVLSGVCAPGASAQTYVLGDSLAHMCSVEAMQGQGTRQAEEICTSALEDEALSMRDRAATYVNRGVIRSNLRLPSRALGDYERSLGFASYLENAELGIAYVGRASVLNAMGHYSEALESANKGLSLGTLRPEVAYYNRALAEERLGNVKAAYYDYKEALKVVPDFAPAAEQLKRFRVVTQPAGS